MTFFGEAVVPRRFAGSIWAVWLLTAGVAAAAVAAAGQLAPLPVVGGAPVTLSWWMLAPAFYIAEMTVVHLRFHRHAHSFSLSEIPLIMGLFLAAPIHLIVGQAVGTMAALAIHRRQVPVKLGFNVAQFSLQTVTAVMVFQALSQGRPPLGLMSAFATLAAVAAALLVANLLVNSAIRLTGDRLSRSEMGKVLTLGGTAAFMNGALALGMVHLLWLRPASAPVAILPPIVLYLAYRAYVLQTQERSQLSEVYEATRELHGITEIDQALEAITRRARSLFDAEVAKVVLLPENNECAFATGVGPGDRSYTMERMNRDSVPGVAELAVARTAGVVDQVWSGSAMAAPLFERDRVIGAMVVAEPVGEVARFGDNDLKLLETLASQVSVSLENGRLEDSLHKVTQQKDELHHQALHDGLTGLANRRLLFEALDRALADGADGDDTALLFLDLDDFKVINDTEGHQAGDELLQLVADRLLATCRSGDTVARLGGDEFGVLLVDLPRPREAEFIAERILETLARPYQLRGRTLWISASLGVAHMADGVAHDELLRRADQSMYTAKWHEKGSYEVFADSTAAGVFRWMELRADLAAAIEKGSLALHYQPVVDIHTGVPVGVEALLRWDHPTLGWVTPTEILSVAEETGHMLALGEWTVVQVCADLARLRQDRPHLWGSLNLSATQVDASLEIAVADAIATHSLPPESLTLEITEAAATQVSEGVLEGVSALGVRIALDDFGTGYSSFARLDRLPIDVLKIDRSFVARVSGAPASPLMGAIVELGHNLGLDIIAEGVETEDHRRFVIEAGCSIAQGWLFAPALPMDEVERFLDEHHTAISV